MEDIAVATAGTGESSGVITGSKPHNHYLVPFLQGPNIPVKIHNDKFVLKIVVRKWKAMKMGLREKNGKSKLKPLIA